MSRWNSEKDGKLKSRDARLSGMPAAGDGQPNAGDVSEAAIRKPVRLGRVESTYPRIQVCGVIDQAEAILLAENGVDDLAFPMGPGVRKVDIEDRLARTVIRTIEAPRYAVLITYLKRAEQILHLADKIGALKIQLHGQISVTEAEKLKRLRPRIHLTKSLVVGAFRFDELCKTIVELSPHIDAFLTDSFDPATGAKGATGITHDWEISRRLIEISEKPVLLAGGLNPSNVAEAILQVKPKGVTVHTGVENATGRKDAELVKAFVTNARKAFAQLA